jgi:hypothetical protein
MMTDDQRVDEMNKYRKVSHPYKYTPLQQSLPDIFSTGSGLFDLSPRTSWDQIEKDIIKRSSKLKEPERNANINLCAGRGIYDFAEKLNVTSIKYQFEPMRGPFNHEIRCWNPYLLQVAGEPFVVYFDPRSGSSRLNSAARSFCFSVMNDRIRKLEPGFEEVNLGILQVVKCKGRPTCIELHRSDNLDFLSLDELQQRIQITYDVWANISVGRTAAESKEQGLDELPLFSTLAS